MAGPADHEPSDLHVVTRFTKQGGRNQRKWRVWYYRLRCPVCGLEFVRLCNTTKGLKLRCVGNGQLKILKKEKKS